MAFDSHAHVGAAGVHDVVVILGVLEGFLVVGADALVHSIWFWGAWLRPHGASIHVSNPYVVGGGRNWYGGRMGGRGER